MEAHFNYEKTVELVRGFYDMKQSTDEFRAAIESEQSREKSGGFTL